MRAPKRGQRRLMLRLFPWTKPADWVCVDRHVWKMTPEAAERLKQMRARRRRNPSGASFVLLHMKAGGIEFLSKDSVSTSGVVQSVRPTKQKTKAARFAFPTDADDAVNEVNARLAGGLAPAVSFASAMNNNPRNRRNPVPKSAPSRALLCIGQLRKLEVITTDGRARTATCRGKWLAWDGRQFHICTVQRQVNATLPAPIVKRHRKFHQANPRGKPFLASMPSPGPGLHNVGLLKSLVYSVPSKIQSPGKNKYLWHHAFGDTGHKGGDSYPTKVMPMLQKDANGNLFIKRRKGNIFRVDQWLRG